MIVHIPDDLTGLVNEAKAGNRAAAEQVWQCVYEELRSTARRMLGAPKLGDINQSGPTTLIQQSFLHFFTKGSPNKEWESRAEFFGALAKSMMRFLVDHRKTLGIPTGGGVYRTIPLGFDAPTLQRFDDAVSAADESLLASMVDLEEVHAIASQVVALRYICGLSIEQAGEAIGIRPRTVSKHWNFARSWLRRDFARRLGMSGELPDISPYA
ncbi:MAG: hypothetical protein EXS10_06925 [Phycisphaerales bacterium]|nr:hypothetical protein [Phycisphaerales bacterium]